MDIAQQLLRRLKGMEAFFPQTPYLKAGIYPEHEIIIYCQSSMRATPVFVQLYEAGYRNIRIYDGAYLEWSSDSSNPVEMPAGASAPVKNDAS